MRPGEYADRLEQLTFASFLSAVKREVAAGVLRLLAGEFRGSVDPYGNAWAPLKWRKGKPLVKTGTMRDTLTAYPTASGVRIMAGVDYAIYHQQGTARMPARKILPSGSLPGPWVSVINAAYTKAARLAVSRG